MTVNCARTTDISTNSTSSQNQLITKEKGCTTRFTFINSN
uniref:Uncharacterized protein n=1 Tax=Arundo donax TaxID=35708 RepID=A0A0A8ZXT0_ARUDO